MGFVCPAHGIDGFLKNVGSSADSIRMQANVMGISSISANVMGISNISAASQMECNEPFFRDCFDNTGKLVTWVSHKQEPFARFKMISQVIKVKKISCGAAMLKTMETECLEVNTLVHTTSSTC